uniref:Uncharacterized protein n=1 Tax=Romanomermis culicivorax TaxID=13658 RepID=A0A915JPU4_ROMCU
MKTAFPENHGIVLLTPSDLSECRVTGGATKPKGFYKDLGLKMSKNAEDLASGTTLPRTPPGTRHD